MYNATGFNDFYYIIDRLSFIHIKKIIHYTYYNI